MSRPVIALLVVLAGLICAPASVAAQATPAMELPAGAQCTSLDGRWIGEVAISPDGATIAAAAQDENGLADIYTLRSTGGPVTLVGSGHIMGGGIAVADDGTVAVPTVGGAGIDRVVLLPAGGGPARSVEVPQGQVQSITSTVRGFMVVTGIVGEILLLEPGADGFTVAWDARTLARDGVSFAEAADVDPTGRWAAIVGGDADTWTVRVGDGSGVTTEREGLIRGLRPALVEEGRGLVMTDTVVGAVRLYDLAGGPDAYLLPANVISLDTAGGRFVWATWDWVENQVCVAPLPPGAPAP